MLNRGRFFEKTLGVAVALAIGSAIAEPVPVGSKSEVLAVKGQIDDLVATGVGVDKLLSMAGETKKGAERYWLYANAFILQAKEGEYAEAKGTLDALRENVTGIPEVNIINLIEKDAGRTAAESPELAAILKESRVRLVAQKIIKNPKGVVFKASYGEALAVCGNWKAALKALAGTGDAVSDIAKAELAQKLSAKIAAFWWDYRPCRELASSMAFKAHAAEIYKKLLDAGKLSFVQKTLAEKRIEEVLGGVKTDKKEKSYGTAERVAVNTASTISKDELSALKKICDTKGLMHCWRFNGDLKDCVGGGEAMLVDGAMVNGHQVDMAEGQNYVYLGRELLPRENMPVTIEIWAVARSFSDGSRILKFGRDKWTRVVLHWYYQGMDMLEVIRNKQKLAALRPVFGSLMLNKEYHLSLVMNPRLNGCWDFAVYSQDAKTGETLSKSNITVSGDWCFSDGAPNDFWLGRSFYGNDASDSSYNEVRIWNRALDEQELTQNAINFHKAGETMKISGEPRRFVGGGNSSAGRETRQQSKLTQEELKKIIDDENAYDKKMLERKFGKGGQR